MNVWRALLLAVLLVAPRAWAEPATYPVEITAAGSPDTVALLETRTRALLRDYSVTVIWSVRADFRPREVFQTSTQAALARIWLDLRQPTQAVLYVVDDAHDRFLVRVVPLEAGYDEVACESVGTIVQASVEALLAGATVGVSREAAEEQVSELEGDAPNREEPPPPAAPAQAPAAPAPSRQPYRLAIDLAYRGQMLEDGPQILHGPEIGASLARPGPRFTAAGFVSLGYRLPLLWQENGVGVALEGVGLRLGPGVRWALGSRAGLSVLGVLGLDVLEADPMSTDPAAEATAPFWLVAPVLGAAVELDVGVAGPLSLWTSAGVEADLSGHHFDVLEGGAPVTVLQAWAIQPVLRLGFRLRP